MFAGVAPAPVLVVAPHLLTGIVAGPQYVCHHCWRGVLNGCRLFRIRCSPPWAKPHLGLAGRLSGTGRAPWSKVIPRERTCGVDTATTFPHTFAYNAERAYPIRSPTPLNPKLDPCSPISSSAASMTASRRTARSTLGPGGRPRLLPGTSPPLTILRRHPSLEPH